MTKMWMIPMSQKAMIDMTTFPDCGFVPPFVARAGDHVPNAPNDYYDLVDISEYVDEIIL